MKTLRIENGETNTAIQENFFTRMQDLFGSPEDDTSFAHLTEQLSEAFELLAVSPDKTLNPPKSYAAPMTYLRTSKA